MTFARRDQRSRKRGANHTGACGILAAMATGEVRSRTNSPLRVAATKVPLITAWFWIAKVASTGMGEAVADYVYLRFGTAVTIAFGSILLISALALQFAVRRYLTWVYWFAVAAVAVTGT